MLKKLKKKLIQFLGTKLGWIFILLLGKSTKITYFNREVWDSLVVSGKAFIGLIWHGRILLPIYAHRNLNVVAMVSQHGDGEMIAQIIHKLGYRTVRGSSTRGGIKAFHAMLAELKKAAICTVMPDGPKGPRQKLKSGVIYMAQRSGAPLLPLTFSSDKHIIVKSWDRFMIFKPFSRSIIMYGKPITVPSDLTTEQVEKFRTDLEQNMIQLEKHADEYFQK